MTPEEKQRVAGWYPIQDGPSVPWGYMAPHESQAKKNHGQTLTRLAERGGLGAAEAELIVTAQPLWPKAGEWDWAELKRRWVERAERVNNAYLAAHPADDIEPVAGDEEWLRAVGGVKVDSLARHWVIGVAGERFQVYYFPLDDTLRLHANNLDADGVTTSYGGCHVVTASPTRGHIRRLCAALGITLLSGVPADAGRAAAPEDFR